MDTPESSLGNGLSNVIRHLFEGVETLDLQRLEREAEHIALEGGDVLLREGEIVEYLYVLLSGRLDVVIKMPDGSQRLAGHLTAGDTVGEMGLVAEDGSPASFIARRDSELVRISRALFEDILTRYPNVAVRLMRFMVRWLDRALKGKDARQPLRTIALIPLSPNLPVMGLARDFTYALSRMQLSIRLLEEDSASHDTAWFDTLENHSDLVIYCSSGSNEQWSRRCFRQADRVVLLIPGEMPFSDLPSEQILPQLHHRPTDLLFLHPPQGTNPANVAGWLDGIRPEMHHHLRLNNMSDAGRVARLITGRAVTLVLSGGGARGFSHIGVISALHEAGVPIDMVGGASMGAMVGAGLALGWSDSQLRTEVKKAFVERDVLNDYTLPLVAMIKGHKVAEALHTHFGAETLIENLWLPWFAVSASLTTGRLVVHQRGNLAQALRAAVSIPAVFPPVTLEDEILVDGGVLNNFPVDVMRAMDRGAVIGVDVSLEDAFTVEDRFDVESLWQLMRRRKGAPGIVRIIIRAGTLRSDAHSKQARSMVDLLIEPETSGIDMMDWDSFEDMVRIGYEEAIRAVQRSQAPFLKSYIKGK